MHLRMPAEAAPFSVGVAIALVKIIHKGASTRSVFSNSPAIAADVGGRDLLKDVFEIAQRDCVVNAERLADIAEGHITEPEFVDLRSSLCDFQALFWGGWHGAVRRSLVVLYLAAFPPCNEYRSVSQCLNLTRSTRAGPRA